MPVDVDTGSNSPLLYASAALGVSTRAADQGTLAYLSSRVPPKSHATRVRQRPSVLAASWNRRTRAGALPISSTHSGRIRFGPCQISRAAEVVVRNPVWDGAAEGAPRRVPICCARPPFWPAGGRCEALRMPLLLISCVCLGRACAIADRTRARYAQRRCGVAWLGGSPGDQDPQSSRSTGRYTQQGPQCPSRHWAHDIHGRWGGPGRRRGCSKTVVLGRETNRPPPLPPTLPRLQPAAVRRGHARTREGVWPLRRTGQLPALK
jgi:hypothetical protein